jgi:inositol-phosphate phosphatase/L-galactose 1-phosphate phosphatase/histidinol-phosphatase
MDSYLEFANFLADEAGKISQQYFRKYGGFSAKVDNSPVTEADKLIEERLTAIIRSQYPAHKIFGEEISEGRATDGDFNANEYVWTIDPIDGTAAFIAGKPTFTTLIGLIHKNKAVLGVIDQPIAKERWLGVTGRVTTFHNREGVRELSPQKKQESGWVAKESIADCTLATTSPQYFSSTELEKFNELSALAKNTVYGGDAYNYGLLASGYIDVIIESGLKTYDYAPLLPILLGAGASVCEWGGDHPHLMVDSKPKAILAHSLKGGVLNYKII